MEFKESWRDEYQKWICGFANAQGGVLYVGVKDNGVNRYLCSGIAHHRHPCRAKAPSWAACLFCGIGYEGH